MNIDLINQFNRDSRYVYMQIHLYINGRTQAPFILTTDSELVDVELLLEVASGSNLLDLKVSSQELSITVDNTKGKYTSSNTQSPLFGKLVAGVPVVVYCAELLSLAQKHSCAVEELSENQILQGSITLGTFYLDRVQASTWEQHGNLMCYDRLYNILPAEISDIDVSSCTTYGEYITTILKGVDPTLQVVSTAAIMQQELPLAYMSHTTCGELLNDFALATYTFLYMGADDKLLIQDRKKHTSQVTEPFTDDNQIYSVRTCSNIAGSDQVIQVDYLWPKDVAEVELVTDMQLMIPPGNSWTPMINWNNTPIVQVSEVTVLSTEDVDIIKTQLGSHRGRIQLSNTGSYPAEGVLSIKGHRGGSTLINCPVDERVATHSVSNAFVQSEDHARALRTALEKLFSIDTPLWTFESRGNPAVPLYSEIELNSEVDYIQFTGVLLRQRITYDGGLAGEMSFIDRRVLYGQV